MQLARALLSITDSPVKFGRFTRAMPMCASDMLVSTNLLLQAALHQPLPWVDRFRTQALSQGSQWHRDLLKSDLWAIGRPDLSHLRQSADVSVS